MMGRKSRKLGALFAIGQGLLTALAPGQSTKLTTKMIGKHFENADQLTPKPAYIRQVRALGVGMAVAGVATLVLESAADESDPTSETDA